MSYLYHFGPAGEIGVPGYRATLDTEGFIHCSYLYQAVAVANALYGDTGPMEIAAIDPDKLTSPVRDEDLYDAGEEFPHIYGPIDADAIVAILPFERDESGFRLPELLPTA
jgi:uncharacterized protein (DUF952 family)